MRHAALILSFAALWASPALAQSELEVVRFEVQQETRFGESVYLLGEDERLGGGDPTRALRLVPAHYPTWSLEVALPRGLRTRARYLLRSNAPSLVGEARNATPVGGVFEVAVAGEAPERDLSLEYYSGLKDPVLAYEEDGGWRQLRMTAAGPGRGPGETLWRVTLRTRRPKLRFILGASGVIDESPDGGPYETSLSQIVLQDGRLYGYRPEQGQRDGRVVRVRDWQSKLLGNSRDIFIYLPRLYDASTRRYPVLYMHDGQNLFGEGALFGGWRAGETADRLIRQGRMEECIIVGVANTSARMDEYIPDEDGGQASRYGRFLIEELKPWVDGALRTKPEAEHTGICGSSLGGIASLAIAWRNPGTFQRVASLSGSYWLEAFTAQAELERAPKLRIWLDSGTGGASGDGYEGTMRVRDMLLGKGFHLGEELAHSVDIGALHNEVAWKGRFGEVLEFLFPAR